MCLDKDTSLWLVYCIYMFNEMIIMFIICYANIIGISLILLNDIVEMKWIEYYNLNNGLVIIMVYYSDSICIGLLSLSLFLINMGKNVLSTFGILVLCSSMVYRLVLGLDILTILYVTCIEIISIFHILLVLCGPGFLYYILYQSLVSVCIWSYLIICTLVLICLYFMKLGLGIGGYYIPSLYLGLISCSMYLMVFVGCTNICLMFNPVELFNSLISDYDSYSLYLVYSMSVLFSLIVLLVWINCGYMYYNIFLYGISSSTLILTNVYIVLICIGKMISSVYYSILYLTIYSILVFIILVLCLGIYGDSSSNNSRSIMDWSTMDGLENILNKSNYISLSYLFPFCLSVVLVGSILYFMIGKYIFRLGRDSSSNNSFKSILSVVIFILLVLSVSSLLTVLERKGLASSHERIGPSYFGWFGLVQILMDGMKLIFKDCFSYTNISSRYMLICSVFHLVFSYLLFFLLYYDYVFGICRFGNILLVLVVLMTNHIVLVICGYIVCNSKWTMLSCIRVCIIYFIYDIILFLILLYMTGNYSSVYIGNILGLSSYTGYSSVVGISYSPLLCGIYLFIVLIEGGRIPIDLIEAESELISGYSIEYGGFLYGLFASAEYSILLFHSILMCMIWIGYSGIYMVMVYVTLIFILFVIIRSSLPRLRYCDLFMIVYGYLFPILIVCSSLTLVSG